MAQAPVPPGQRSQPMERIVIRAGARDPTAGAPASTARTRATSQAERPVVLLAGCSTWIRRALVGSSPSYRARIWTPLESSRRITIEWPGSACTNSGTRTWSPGIAARLSRRARSTQRRAASGPTLASGTAASRGARTAAGRIDSAELEAAGELAHAAAARVERASRVPIARRIAHRLERAVHVGIGAGSRLEQLGSCPRRPTRRPRRTSITSDSGIGRPPSAVSDPNRIASTAARGASRRGRSGGPARAAGRCYPAATSHRCAPTRVRRTAPGSRGPGPRPEVRRRLRRDDRPSRCGLGRHRWRRTSIER